VAETDGISGRLESGRFTPLLPLSGLGKRSIAWLTRSSDAIENGYFIIVTDIYG